MYLFLESLLSVCNWGELGRDASTELLVDGQHMYVCPSIQENEHADARDWNKGKTCVGRPKHDQHCPRVSLILIEIPSKVEARESQPRDHKA